MGGENTQMCDLEGGEGVERYKCVTGRRGGGWRGTNV